MRVIKYNVSYTIWLLDAMHEQPQLKFYTLILNLFLEKKRLDNPKFFLYLFTHVTHVFYFYVLVFLFLFLFYNNIWL